MTLRLALYSDQETPVNQQMDERLLHLIGVNKPRIAYISATPDPQHYFYERKKAYYSEMGAYLDIYIDSESLNILGDIGSALRCDAIHLSGGNTFAFLKWVQDFQLLPILQRFAQEKGVLIGESAGAILMTSDIRTSELCGDAPIRNLAGHQGLGLTPFLFLPHFNESEISAVALRTFSSHQLPIFACPDGSGVVIEGDAVESYGTVSIIDLHGDL